VRIRDKGEFSVDKEKDSELLIELKGKKLNWKYALIRTKFKGKDSWLFFNLSYTLFKPTVLKNLLLYDPKANLSI
jgi:hypothetical protein